MHDLAKTGKRLKGESVPTKWVNLKVCKVQILIQVEEPHNETGQNPEDKSHIHILITISF